MESGRGGRRKKKDDLMFLAGRIHCLKVSLVRMENMRGAILEREQCVPFELRLRCPWDTELSLRGLAPREKSGLEMCFGE